MNARPIRISEPDIGAAEEAAVLAVLRSGQLAQGPVVERFELLCAQMAGSAHAVAVCNGTVALEACLEVLGVGPGDEVVTSPLTFAATVNAVLRAGATVRFADVTADFTLDPDAVASLVGPRTAAVLPVHLYGLPADMPALAQLADRHALALVEDAAQAHGAAVDGRAVGSFGLGSFSFYATKNVAAGEGGVVTTQSDAQAATLRRLRNQGMVERYRYEMVGRNLRLTDLQAAVAVPQLERLPQQLAARRANAQRLTEALARAVPDVVLPVEPAGRRSAWHQYTVLLPTGVDRARVVDHLGRHGVGSGVYYPRLAWDYEPYRAHPQVRTDPTPRARDAARRCLSLPVHPRVGPEECGRIAQSLAAAIAASPVEPGSPADN